MGEWVCPECGRLFGRTGQSHDCAPGLSLEEYFETGPVHADVVSVGIFLKNPRKFAELRPKDNWVAVSFSLRSKAHHPTITRKVVEYGNRYWHVANVRRVDDVDADLIELLAEAYHDQPT